MVLSFFFASFCTFRCEWKANSFYSFASNRFEELSILCLFLIVKSPLMCTPGIYVHNFGSEITVNRRLHHQQGLIFEHLHVIDASISIILLFFVMLCIIKLMFLLKTFPVMFYAYPSFGELLDAIAIPFFGCRFIEFLNCSYKLPLNWWIIEVLGNFDIYKKKWLPVSAKEERKGLYKGRGN